ncbi:MAG: hypothetical protein ACXABY_30155, partial [Candidatus Thorarchaeota archaeon]
DTWASTDDPDYVGTYTNYIPTTSNHENTATETNTIQATPDISYWVKIRHKREADLFSAEQYTDNGSGANDIIYYGYATSTSTTLEQFTSDTDPVNASPVEIITSYGSSGNGSGVIEVQVRKPPGPPILGSIFVDTIHAQSDVTIIGNDDGSCSPTSASVPAVAYVTSETYESGTTIESTAGTSITTSAIDLATIVDQLESTATIILDDDDDPLINYTLGSSSNYEIVYCDATSLSPDNELDFTNVTGYGILVVRGNLKGGFDWNGIVIVSGTAAINATIHGAVLADRVETDSSLDIYYSSCEIDKANGSNRYSAFMWEDKKLN